MGSNENNEAVMNTLRRIEGMLPLDKEDEKRFSADVTESTNFMSRKDLIKQYSVVFLVLPLQHSVNDNRESVNIFEYVFRGNVYMCFKGINKMEAATQENCALIELPSDADPTGPSRTYKFSGIQNQANLFRHQADCDTGTIQTLVRKVDSDNCIKFFMSSDFFILFRL